MIRAPLVPATRHAPAGRLHPPPAATMKAIQDHYPPEFAHCFGCGPANVNGHHLKSYLVGDRTEARFTPAAMYSGGFPGNVFGGMIASLMDCHGTASAAAFAWRDRGLALGEPDDGTGDGNGNGNDNGNRNSNGEGLIRFVTASLKLDFRRPTPLGVELTLIGELAALEGRKARITLALSAGDTVCVTGEMLAVQLPARHD